MGLMVWRKESDDDDAGRNGDDDGYNEMWWQNLRFKWGCGEKEGYSNTIGSKISTANHSSREYKQNNKKKRLSYRLGFGKSIR